MRFHAKAVQNGRGQRMGWKMDGFIGPTGIC
jgi:hypothetical protein